MTAVTPVQRWTAYGTSGLARIIKGYTGLGLRSAAHYAHVAVELGGLTFTTDIHVVGDPEHNGRQYWRVEPAHTKWELQRLAPPGEEKEGDDD